MRLLDAHGLARRRRRSVCRGRRARIVHRLAHRHRDACRGSRWRTADRWSASPHSTRSTTPLGSLSSQPLSPRRRGRRRRLDGRAARTGVFGASTGTARRRRPARSTSRPTSSRDGQAARTRPTMFAGDGALAYDGLIRAARFRRAQIVDRFRRLRRASRGWPKRTCASTGRRRPTRSGRSTSGGPTSELARDRIAHGQRHELDHRTHAVGPRPRRRSSPSNRRRSAIPGRATCTCASCRTPTCPSCTSCACRGTGIVAFCSFWLVLDEVHINNLAVRGDFRGQGAGTALLEHVIQAARAVAPSARRSKCGGQMPPPAGCTSGSASKWRRRGRIITSARRKMRLSYGEER